MEHGAAVPASYPTGEERCGGSGLVRDNEIAGLSSRWRDGWVELIEGTRMPITAFRK